ncbi:MAG: thioredoxin family protein [Candidatus Heimdallarchaeota archaeon]
MDRITETFFNSGQNFEEMLAEASENQRMKFELNFQRGQKNFGAESFVMDLEYSLNIIAVGAPWCFDCKMYLPILELLVRSNPRLRVRYFNKDHYPFLCERMNGGEKIPQILIYAPDYVYVTRWIERPTLTSQLIASIRGDLGWERSVQEQYNIIYHRALLKDLKAFQAAFLQEIKNLLIRTNAVLGTTKRFYVATVQ